MIGLRDGCATMTLGLRSWYAVSSASGVDTRLVRKRNPRCVSAPSLHHLIAHHEAFDTFSEPHRRSRI